MRDYSKVLKECYENIIIPTTLVATQLDINICILENDGGYKAASFNAATLALIMAGIPISDMVVASTAGMIDTRPTIDLISEEEKGRHKSLVNVCLSANHKSMAYIDMESKKLSTEQMEALIKLNTKGCETIHGVMRLVLKEYIASS